MNIAVLTTDTLHHAYFIERISKVHNLIGVLVEGPSKGAPFDTSHSFETEREEYESSVFFGGEKRSVFASAEAKLFASINDSESVSHLAYLNPDVTIVFGTGIIKKALINAVPGRILNLHGGDPEKYRGLDTHLWAIYHGEFEELVTTLHVLTPSLDDGPIISKKQIVIPQGAKLSQLRHFNTEVCIELCSGPLTQLEGKAQVTKGRYYSFMPSCLKEICVGKFEKYAARLLDV